MDQILQGRTQNLLDNHRAEQTHLDDIDSQILSLFLENELQRVRTLAPDLRISLSAVHR
jgi:DNA-binding Lrp family transcriptional regulator